MLINGMMITHCLHWSFAFPRFDVGFGVGLGPNFGITLFCWPIYDDFMVCLK